MGAVSRRGLLTAAGVATGAVLGGGVTRLPGVGREPAAPIQVADRVPFTGVHQAGIATPQQAHLCFAAFDVTAADRAGLVALLRRWSDAARRLTSGRPEDGDSAEADGLSPARLTVAFGFGPTLFEAGGIDRFGLRHHRPAPLVPIPPIPGDALDPGRCDGDIGIQACADDPFVARHAVRTMARLAGGDALLRWRQTGFGPTAGATPQQTPRSLLGHKDGTNNVRADQEQDLAAEVWVGEDDMPWMRGGSYLVARRIRIVLEAWDRTPVPRQDAIIGRHRDTGAPLGSRREHDPVDLSRRDRQGRLMIPADAHIRLAAASSNGGARLLRRGYAFDDGVDVTGHADAGLFFLCFQRDPRRQFLPIQRRLATGDALRGFIQHRASAVFACPGGATTTGWVGEPLFS